MKNPVVQIPMCTYNHELYIKDALIGILNQETNFDYEILIGDDASTDNTVSIVKEFQQDYPNRIKLIAREKNLGAASNTYDLFRQLRAPFIAFCDGDDYWTDPNKLQKQIDSLRENLDCDLCYTNALVVSENQKVLRYSEPIDKKRDISDLLMDMNLQTCTVVARNVGIDKIKSNFKELVFGDIYLYIYILSMNNSKALYLDNNTSVYRRHRLGTFKQQDELSKNSEFLKVYTQIYQFIPKVFENVLRSIIQSYLLINFEHLSISERINLLIKYSGFINIKTSIKIIFLSFPQKVTRIIRNCKN